MRRRTFLRTGLLGAGLPAFATFPTTWTAGWIESEPRRRAGEVLRLNSNENPLGIPPVAREAILKGLEEANRYPRDSRTAIIEALARKHSVDVEGVVLGNGSTEVLQMGFQARLDPRLRLVAPTPTYEDVFEYADPHPWIDVRKVPLGEDFSHDLEAMEREASGAPGPVLVYVCNPNNPTGSLTSTRAVLDWIERAPPNVHFLVDEAYFEFVDSEEYFSLDQVAWRNPQVVVTRTFSKVYGMAGLRLGYAVAHPETARLLKAFAPGTNTNHLVLVAARAALDDPVWVERSVAANEEARRRTYAVLQELDLEYIPSHTNFVMHRIKGPLRDYIDRMAEAGIRVGRPFPPMLGYNRVSLGLPEEMDRFAETLRRFRRRGWV